MSQNGIGEMAVRAILTYACAIVVVCVGSRRLLSDLTQALRLEARAIAALGS